MDTDRARGNSVGISIREGSLSHTGEGRVGLTALWQVFGLIFEKHKIAAMLQFSQIFGIAKSNFNKTSLESTLFKRQQVHCYALQLSIYNKTHTLREVVVCIIKLIVTRKT